MNEARTRGIGFCGLLAIMFIGLKLAKVIAWSWLWVLSPLWLPVVTIFGIWLVFAVCCVIIAALVYLFTSDGRAKAQNEA